MPGSKTSRAPQPTAEHIATVLSELFPEPGSLVQQDFVALPSATNPKLVAPLRPRAVSAGAVRRIRRSHGPAQTLALAGLSVAARSGALDLLSGRFRVGRGETDVLAHLGRELGRPVHVAWPIAPVRVSQKPVLQVLSPRGDTLGWAKIGLNRLTRELVAHEADVLAALAPLQPAPLRLPPVLLSGSWNGHELLVQETFPGNRSRPAPEPDLLAAMFGLAAVRGIHSEILRRSQFWYRLQQGLGPGALAGVWNAEVAAAAGQLAGGLPGIDRPMSFGSWHGDWAPWNMTWSAGQVQLWDWEGYQEDVPLGFDLVHHTLQTAVVQHGEHPAVAVPAVVSRVAGRLAAFGLDREAAGLVPLLYLLHLIAGFAATGETGSRLARLETWLPQTVPQLAAVRGV